MNTTWRREIPPLIVILGMWATAAAVWRLAPDRLPVHWNLAGEVDRYGGKFEGLLILPLVAVAVYLLMLFLPRIDPGRANYETFARAYGVIRLAVLALVAFVYGCMVLAALGYQVDTGLLVPLAVGILLCVLGNLMGKIRPNWFVGVRTPWTLSSRESWNKTHRLAGRLFVAMGCAVAAFGFFPSAWLLACLIAAGAVMMIWITVYSYVVWRHDPDRQRPADTSPSAG
jgi:uncharacterized membrane protein